MKTILEMTVTFNDKIDEDELNTTAEIIFHHLERLFDKYDFYLKAKVTTQGDHKHG